MHMQWLRACPLSNVLCGHSSSVIIQETKRSEKAKRSEKENPKLRDRKTRRSESEIRNWIKKSEKRSEKDQEIRTKNRRITTVWRNGMNKMTEYIPYEIRTGHPADFEVEYEIIQPSITGDLRRIFPGIRCDFLYEGDVPNTDGMWMIWPEFLDEKENPITDLNQSVASTGKAKMWILRPETRLVPHQKRIQVGVKGYFMSGPHRLANVTITKVIALFSNPIKEL